MRRIGGLLGLGLLAGCADDVASPAELAAVCGQDGPFQFLKLEAGEHLAGIEQIGDRVYTRVGRPPDEVSIYAYPEDPVVIESGPCGESPVRLDPAIRSVFIKERWPGVLLGRLENGDIVTVEPGVAPSHVLFAGIADNPWSAWTEHGLVSLAPGDGDTGAVRVHRYPDDPRGETAIGEVLYEPVPLTWPVNDIVDANVTILPEEVLLVDADHALVRVDLVDGAVTLEQTNVRSFHATYDGRMLWQALAQANEEPYSPAGRVYLRDRGSGEEVYLGDGVVLGSPFMFAGYVVLNLGGQTFRVFDADTLEHFDLPELLLPWRLLDDGRWLVYTPLPERTSYALFDPADGSVTPLAEGQPVWTRADGLELLDVPKCCDDELTSFADEGPLELLPFDGSPRRRLADRATRFGVRVDDGRRLGVRDIASTWLGELVLFDLDANTAARIDGDVLAASTRLVPSIGEGVLAYSVEDGARSGVWLARLPGA